MKLATVFWTEISSVLDLWQLMRNHKMVEMLLSHGTSKVCFLSLRMLESVISEVSVMTGMVNYNCSKRALLSINVWHPQSQAGD